jgi:(1->4)-alpha-D-glucan 1-alpha-D-glucosylmutase
MGVLAPEPASTDIREDQQLWYVPSSTYRLQLNRLFTFRQATALLDYLQDLGISHCYASPFFMGRPGSMHGYDVTDPTRLNPEIGALPDFSELTLHLKRRSMGLIADVAPNHMCVTHPSNRWWWDVLENGANSTYSKFFDIDWRPPKAELANKVLLPFLPDQFGRALENQELVVNYDGGAFVIACNGVPYPLAPRTWSLTLCLSSC